MIQRFLLFNDTATTEIYTLSLHDALPISCRQRNRMRRTLLFGDRTPLPCSRCAVPRRVRQRGLRRRGSLAVTQSVDADDERSEEHTSELQSRQYLVCRLLLEKKKTYKSFR